MSKTKQSSLHEALKATVLQIIADAYEHAAREPNMSTAMVAEMVSDSLLWEHDVIPTTTSKYARVRSALEAQRKAGKLGSSMGLGANGREARCYEPKS